MFRSGISMPTIESTGKVVEISKELERLIEKYSTIDSDTGSLDFNSLRNLFNAS
jgi:hypothetical protein